MSLLSVRLGFAALALLACSAVRAAELPILSKARAYLGTEAALNNVTSIHYVGTLVTNDPSDPKKETRAAIEIIFQKPDEQRVTTTSDKTIETTALDGYDGWMRVTSVADPSKWQQTLLGGDGIKRLRANTWENVGFFRGLDREGGRIEDEGPSTIEGVACEKIAFIHSPTITFFRYFDLATGRLVYSETEGGGIIREEGQIVAQGVRFPKRIVTSTKIQTGQLQTVTITFEKVTVNEKFPSSFFSVPSLEQR